MCDVIYFIFNNSFDPTRVPVSGLVSLPNLMLTISPVVIFPWMKAVKKFYLI